MLNETENTGEIRVASFSPGELDNEKIIQLELKNHVLAYGLSNDPEYLERRVKELYQSDDKYRQIFLAFIGDKPVGSLIIKRYPITTDDEYANRFWERLQQLYPAMAEASRIYSPNAYHIAGISVLPEYRNSAIAKHLMIAAFSRVKPSFVMGGTKRPEQVVARSSTMGTLGYRTFYGTHEVTPGISSDSTDKHKPVLDAYLFSLQKEEPFYFSANLPLGLPNVESFDPQIQKAFGPINDRIKAGAEGPHGALIQPLISIKKELLDT